MRAWTGKEFLYFHSNHDMIHTLASHDTSDYIFQLWTGFKDSDGEFIYEGDHLDVIHLSSGEKIYASSLVLFREGCFGIKIKDKDFMSLRGITNFGGEILITKIVGNCCE